MKKIIALAFCLAFQLSLGCAIDHEGPPAVDPPVDAAPGAPDAAPVEPDPEYAVAWPTPGRNDSITFNPYYCTGLSGATTVTVVGNCRVEPGDDGQPMTWTNGRTLSKGPDGGWVFNRKGAKPPGECHVSLVSCGRSPFNSDSDPLNDCATGDDWAWYGCPGSPAAPGQHQGGYYEHCGTHPEDPDYTCDIAFVWVPGGQPQTRGNNP